MKQAIEVLLISKRQNFLRRIKLHLSLVVPIVVLLSFMILAGPGIWLYNTLWYRIQGTSNIESLEKDNLNLLVRLDSLKFYLSSAHDDLAKYIDFDSRERTYWQLNLIHPDVWSMGIGGTVYEPNSNLLARQTGRVLNNCYELVEMLKAKCLLRIASIGQINDQIYKNLSLWSHVPSINPVITGYSCSSFGYRVDPIDKTIRMHSGVDIGANRGTAIHASADGVISYAGWNSGYGFMVDINHGYGFVSRYAHCSKVLVSVGEVVKRGQEIAIVGSTGRAISPHLHYEVHVSNLKVNPRNYISQSNIVFD